MPTPQLTLVLPYYNEADFIGPTLASLAAQTNRDFVLVLVDNASSDGSQALCRAVTQGWNESRVEHCHEAQPGKIFALKHGIARVETPLLATLDADTIYPPHYVATVLDLFARNPAAAMVMAADIYSDPDSAAAQRRRRAIWLLSRLFPAKCHTGAFGQAFRTDAFRRAGGYDETLWGYVLEDHEIVHRVGRYGGQVYAPGHYCSPSERRTDRASVSWTGWESLLYVLVPNRWMDWFFYRFLARRFAARGLDNRNLRAKNWASDQPSNSA